MPNVRMKRLRTMMFMVEPIGVLVLVSGGGTNLQAIIDASKSGALNANVTAVISNKPEAYGLERAKKNKIEAVCIPSAGKKREEYERELAARIKKYKPNLIVFAGFMRVLTHTFFEEMKAFSGKMMNVHPSLLPSFGGEGMYGMRVHDAVIASGAKFSGCTVHFVEEGVDAGPIIMQAAFQVKSDDTAETLAARVHEQEHKLLPRAIQLFAEGRLRVEGRRTIIADSKNAGSKNEDFENEEQRVLYSEGF